MRYSLRVIVPRLVLAILLIAPSTGLADPSRLHQLHHG